MSKSFGLLRCNILNVARYKCCKITVYYGKRMLLSQAYHCENEWAKRLDHPLLKNIKLDQYFIDTDKKFGSKNLASGVDIDLFANSVQDADQLDELEHLLYRFRRTKRAVELMDSTTYAVIRIYLKLKDYESLFRILEDPENYGIFPDSCCYNILMDTFIKEKLFKEAVKVAILMMLQEDFSNEIGSLLALYSCHMYLKLNSFNSTEPEAVQEEKNDEEEEEEEEQLVRVPFIRNPFFDDHFHLTNPQHLIGKTLFLAGRALHDDVLGKSFQLLGLGMYEKWEDALQLLNSLAQSKEAPILLSDAVEEFKKCLNFLSHEDLRKDFEVLFSKLQEGNRIESSELEHHLNMKLQDLSALEDRDIQLQKKWFGEWEQKRRLALEKENLEIELEERSKKIAEKKDYLYWKEKHLFFFENALKILAEYELAQEKISKLNSGKQAVDTYVPPEIVSRPVERKTRYQRIALAKKI